ncbi:hypothetical protein [Olsenella absiana]|jgi:hypothetical protein
MLSMISWLPLTDVWLNRMSVAGKLCGRLVGRFGAVGVVGFLLP